MRLTGIQIIKDVPWTPDFTRNFDRYSPNEVQPKMPVARMELKS